MTHGLKNVAFTTPAPFNENGDEVLYDEVERNTQAIMEAGGRTFIPCGNTGEYYSLTFEERRKIVERTVDTVNDDCTVIAGVGGSTKSAIECIRSYEKVGVDGVMVHDLDHTYLHRRGVIDYYRQIATATDLGIVLYKRGSKLSLPVISELSTVENIVGIKFAVNDINEFSRTIEEVPGDLTFINGIAERFAPSFALEGAEGFSSGIGSFVPEASLALMEAIEENDWERAVEIRDIVRPYEELRSETGQDNDLVAANNVPAVKYGLELAGHYGGPVREPLVELSDADKERAREYYSQIKKAELQYSA